MSLVIALDEVSEEQIRRHEGTPKNPAAVNVGFFRSSSTIPDSPSACMATYRPGVKSAAHFHTVDQFQIIMDGKGTFGRHDVTPYHLHFSRAYTPYGPLHADPETGWTFLTLRTRHDPGAQRFPESKEKLKQIPDRRPWQATSKVVFPMAAHDVRMQEIPGIKDERGLFANALAMAPDARMTTPDPANGGGLYVVVLKGSLIHDNKERKAPAVAYIKSNESAFSIHAGPQGLEGLLLNFPRVLERAPDALVPAHTAGMGKWQCELCAFAYDEAMGMPGDGIAAGTRWEDVPDTWSCPDCGTGKNDFSMVRV